MGGKGKGKGKRGRGEGEGEEGKMMGIDEEELLLLLWKERLRKV